MATFRNSGSASISLNRLAKLTGIELGTGDHAGELLIRWEASDAMLAARRWRCLFSERPEGPWSTIVRGARQYRRLRLAVDNRVPDRIFVRLDVRDEAGQRRPIPNRRTNLARPESPSRPSPAASAHQTMRPHDPRANFGGRSPDRGLSNTTSLPRSAMMSAGQ